MTTEPPQPTDPTRQVSLPSMLWELIAARFDIFRFSLSLQQKYGSFILLPFALPAYILSDPRDLRHILITNADNYHKIGALKIARSFMGDGLVTSDGEYHHRQRRAMQPMFHRQRIQGFANIMIEVTQRRIASWREDEPLDIPEQTIRMTLAIISRSLFSVDLDATSTELSRAILAAQSYIVNEIRIPLPGFKADKSRRYREAVAELDKALDAVVHPRTLPDAVPKDDMLQMLLDIRFEDGGRMSEKELRDEIVTLFVAGHETTASSLAWTFYLLASNPEAEAKLCEEIDRVLGGRIPTLEDIPQLKYAEMVMWESMRLRPPIWLMGRLILQDDNLPSGVQLKAGRQVLIVNYAAHRNPVHFPEPDKFIPERFAEKTGIAQAYLPFSVGIRSCVGEPFAKMEIILTLAMVYRQYQFKVHPSCRADANMQIVLRPHHNLRLVPIKRKNTPALV